MLESHRIEVTAVNSVSGAMKAFARKPPHILISDIGMAGESGYDLIRKVRQLPATPAATFPRWR
jgi:CheY-like chemotaxis protein